MRKERAYNDIMNELSILQKHYSDLIDEVMGEKYSYEGIKKDVVKAEWELE